MYCAWQCATCVHASYFEFGAVYATFDQGQPNDTPSVLVFFDHPFGETLFPIQLTAHGQQRCAQTYQLHFARHIYDLQHCDT